MILRCATLDTVCLFDMRPETVGVLGGLGLWICDGKGVVVKELWWEGPARLPWGSTEPMSSPGAGSLVSLSPPLLINQREYKKFKLNMIHVEY
jgi:hypothetical protein